VKESPSLVRGTGYTSDPIELLLLRPRANMVTCNNDDTHVIVSALFESIIEKVGQKERVIHGLPNPW
jgi:hypothetical protein